ncbi:MAG TPA: sigma-70 family RNA polymerase sigma factor [Actinoplanes sp.]|nr:sigma-70 family RNA polymerase sigma factor [Actinoplanes sp.]
MDDEQRFTSLYEKHYGHVARFVLRRAPDLDTGDVVASVFTTAWRRLPDVPADEPLPWLYAVARHTLANEFRGRRRARQLDEQVRAAPAGHLPDPAEGVVDQLALATTLAGLHDRDQEILRLIAWEGLSVREVATVLGCGRTAVAMRVYRLRRAFRHLLAASDAPSPSLPVHSRK